MFWEMLRPGAAQKSTMSLCLRNGILGEGFLWRFNMRRFLTFLCLFCRIWYLVFGTFWMMHWRKELTYFGKKWLRPMCFRSLFEIGQWAERWFCARILFEVTVDAFSRSYPSKVFMTWLWCNVDLCGVFFWGWFLVFGCLRIWWRHFLERDDC